MNKKIILLGRTGAGKTTLVNELISLVEEKGEKAWFFRSATNRERREGEDNSEYEFVTNEEFDKMELISKFISKDGFFKYGVLPENNEKDGIGFFSPISQHYAVDTANNMDNVSFIVLDFPREERLKRLLNRGEDEEAIRRRFDIEDSEGEYDFSIFPKDTIIVSDINLTPKEIAQKIIDKILK